MSELTELAEKVEPVTPQTYHDTMVGDGKQYASDEDLAKGKANADLHIKELQDKLDDLQENQSTIDEVLEEIRKPISVEDDDGQGTPAPAASVNPDEVVNLVDKRIDAKNAVANAKANSASTLALLTEHYGSETAALRAVKKASGGNPIFVKTIDDLGNTAPTTCVQFVTSRAPKEEGGINTPGVSDNGSAESIIAIGDGFTYSYCKKVRAESPAEYKTPEFRSKMEAAVVKHGDAWFNT